MSPLRPSLSPQARVYPRPLFPITPTIRCAFSLALSFHPLTNPSLEQIDLQVLYFHTFTNPFFHNSFLLIIICVAPCFSVSVFSMLSSSRQAFAPKESLTPFACHTYEKRAKISVLGVRNSFPCHTYKITPRKSFPCHTSEKQGVWAKYG
jgi:hypothetical protein